ncbi:hypothetical protein HWV62_44750 [Athelia sp. TMB]|nr:hypothetical protein HWV62_44750 [Athelia sp. TMB]
MQLHNRRLTSIHQSIHTAAQVAAACRAVDIMEIMRLEQDVMVQEREATVADRKRARTEIEEEPARNHELRGIRICELEHELAMVQTKLENEQLVLIEEAETREREGQESLESNEAVRNQLGDISKLVPYPRDDCERKKVLVGDRFAEREAGREQKGLRMQAS